MNLSKLQNNLLEIWTGANFLRLSWLMPSDYRSASRVPIQPVANGKFLTFTCAWSHENVAREDVILLGYDEQQEMATAAWVDFLAHEQHGDVLSRFNRAVGRDCCSRLLRSTAGTELELVYCDHTQIRQRIANYHA